MLVVRDKLYIILIPKCVKPSDGGIVSLGGDSIRRGWLLRALIVRRLNSISCDDTIDFGNHENTDHLLSPALIVLAIEARDVGDGQRGGFVGGHIDRVSLKSER